MNKLLKRIIGTKSFRAGGYSVFATALVIAIAVAVNMFAGALPSSATQLDFTENGLFSVSEQTERILKSVNKDVRVYWIVSSGSEDTGINNLLERYKDLTPHITVTKIDPAEYPNFAKQYTDSTVQQNSLVFVCGNMSRYVDYYDIYQQVESENFDTYYYYYYYYGYSQYYDYLYDWVFYGENAFTSAINYVTSDTLPTIAILEGHGEEELSSDLLNALESDNYTHTVLNLLTSVTGSAVTDSVTAIGSDIIASADDIYTAIPDNTDIILINAPTSDITAAEAEALIKYIDNGGNMIINAALPEHGTLTNLEKVTAHMGITFADGIVIEGSSDYCYRYPYYLLPDIQDTEITSALISDGSYILYPVARGIIHSEDIGTYTALLTSSDNSFAKLAGYSLNTYNKETGDIDGPFDLAAAVSDGASRMAVFTSAAYMDDSVNAMVSGANRDLLLNTIGWMTGQEDKISIRYKNFDSASLTVPQADSRTLSIVFIGAIPLSLILTGIAIIVWRKRR